MNAARSRVRNAFKSDSIWDSGENEYQSLWAPQMSPPVAAHRGGSKIHSVRAKRVGSVSGEGGEGIGRVQDGWGRGTTDILRVAERLSEEKARV